MWIGTIRLIVHTKDAPNAGTDSLVQATIIRDCAELATLNPCLTPKRWSQHGNFAQYRPLKLSMR
jgi:hypothetical protein